MPEHGSATLLVKAMIENLSLRGAKVFVRSLKKEHRTILMRARRQCFLTFTVPDSKLPLVLRGEIVWVDLRTEDRLVAAYFGIELAEPAPDESERLVQFLQVLSSSGSGTH